MRTCTGCGEQQAETSFYSVRRDRKDAPLRQRLHSKCKTCRCAQVRAWLVAEKLRNPAYERTRYRRRRLKDPEGFRARRRKEAGIPEPSRPMPERCEVCGGPPKGGKSLCVDHDHTSGKFRGWLCGTCNAALGFCSDKPELLEALAEYLRSHG